MPLIGANGGLLGSKRTTSVSSGAGVWTPNEQVVLRRANSWQLTDVDPYFSSVSLLLHMNGSNGSTTFTDNSSSPKSSTAYGNASVSTTQSKFGGASAYFDGNGDYVTVDSAGSSVLNWNTGDYTLEYWIYPVAFSQTGHALPKSPAVGRMNTSNGNEWSFGPISNGTIRFAYYGSGGELGLTTTNTITTGAWHHLAFTHSSGTMSIYVNGALSATGTVSGTPAGGLTYLQLGYSYGSSLQAYLDELRVTSGNLRYTANFTPPTAPFPNA